MITTVVGSYPKIGPGTKAPNLRTAINRAERGELSSEELQGVKEQVTAEVIQEQTQAGLDLVTDGQVRWDDGQTYLARAISGFSFSGLIRYFDTNTYFRQPVVEGLLKWSAPITVADYQFASSHSVQPVKAVLTGPYTLGRLSRDQQYHDQRRLVLDLAEVLNQEARALQAAGAPVVQFDEPAILKHKEDFPLFQEAMKRLTRGLNPTLALYTYFGDISGMYPDFLKLPFQVFGLDYVMGQANWDVVRDLPSDASLGLGVVNARNTRMETEEEIGEALRRIAPVASPENLYINPNCGLEFLPRETAYRKLVRMVEGAKRALEVTA